MPKRGRSLKAKAKRKPSSAAKAANKPTKARFSERPRRPKIAVIRGPAIRANVMPCLTYRDAPAAIDFLCKAFGFTRKMVVEGEGGAIAHAELTLGNAMVMLGAHKDTEYGRLVKSPRDVGICTQTIYLVVPDPNAHYIKAKAAGADIVLPLTTKEYGGRDYTCRDPEGHVWTFGTYDPWA
jgi:uncharacterized glyoxalase superfamily protein PhnB